jgi:excisionase family DNA binding protein
LLTYGDVGELCGCSHVTVRRWVKAGRLRVTRLAQNRARIREDELVRFLEAQTR